ncbi:MAG: rhomboid family intramembrane serine protease [Acidimicrobiales bacterium]
MIPLKDFNPTRRRAWATLGLIVACVLVYFWVQPPASGALLDIGANRFTYSKAAIPEELTSGEPASAGEVAKANPAAAASCEGVTVTREEGRVRLDGDPDAACFPGKNVYLAAITSMFLHGSVTHLAFNMLFLWIFGNNLEDRWGRTRYLLFYVGAGIAATLAFVITSPRSAVPLIGASGAIAGVMGAYLVLFPRARILGLLGIIPLPLPAWAFLGFWFFSQFLGGSSGVAYAAHVGGFLFGMAVGGLVRAVTPKPPEFAPTWR